MLKKIMQQSPEDLQKSPNKLLQFVAIIIALFIIFYILHIGASFIVPFIIALLLSFSIMGLSNIFKAYRIPSVISMILSLSCYAFLFWLIGNIFNANFQELMQKVPEYEVRIAELIASVFEYFEVEQPETVTEYFARLDFVTIGRDFGTAIANIFSKIGLIMFYVLFILLEHRYFGAKLKAMIRNEGQENKVLSALMQIKHDVKSYFVIKTGVSLVTGGLSYLVLMFFGVDFALFWAFLIFAFNFIPTIGSVIAVLFPVALALVQFESLYSVVFLFIGLTGIQVLMGNIIEPRFVGNKLNLSPLVIILSLGFWGYIWGIIGMLLSVPIMVILNIILSKFDSSRPFAVLFSEKGDLKIDVDEPEQNRKELIKKLKKRLSF